MKKFLVFCMVSFVSVVPAMPLKAAWVFLREIHENDQQKSDRDVNWKSDIQAKAELLGLGADITIVIRSADHQHNPVTRHGTINEISAEGLRLKAKDEILQVQYSQMERLNLTRDEYKAQGEVDPVAVHRVVIELGIGQTVKVTSLSNQEIKGKIQSITSGSFMIIDSETGHKEAVLFSDVTNIRKTAMRESLKADKSGGVGSFILRLLDDLTVDLD